MNRREVLSGLLASSVLFSLPIAYANLPVDSADQGVLRMGLRYSLSHAMVQNIFLPWTQELLQKSEQRLNIRLYGAGEICPDDSVLNAILLDTLSIGVVNANQMIPPLPMSSLLDTPLLFSSAQLGSLVAWDMMQKYSPLRNEFRLLQLLWVWTSPPMYLHTINKPIVTSNDIQGLRFIIWPGVDANLIRVLGAVPVHAKASDTYNFLQRNQADGILCPLSVLESYNLCEIIRYTIEVPFGCTTFVTAMNKEVWYGLLPVDKALLTAMTGRNMSAKCGMFLDKYAVQTRQELLDKGHHFSNISLEDIQKWEQLMIPLQMESSQFNELRAAHVQEFETLVMETRTEVKAELQLP